MLKRRITQLTATVLYNSGLISDLPRRYMPSRFCVPGLNCQFCPAAAAGCPLNYLERIFAGKGRNFPASSLAWFLLFSIALGRVICGWLCPFGLVQDLLDKVPFLKIHKNRVTRILSYFKYVVFFGVIVGLQAFFGFIQNRSVLIFCQYLCPNLWLDESAYELIRTGTLQSHILSQPSFIFFAALLVLSLFLYRPFCRFFCPLGAFYGFFNRFALFSVKLKKERCVHCGACLRVCPMDIREVGDHECISCGRCKDACRLHAITGPFRKK